MLARFVVLLTLGGCNQFYDLSETEPRDEVMDFDFDGDEIPNSEDNCPTVDNTDQLDADVDEIGDACDPCPSGPEARADIDADGVDDMCDPCLLGPQHDEDSDELMDACDNCPATPNAEQANSDGDDLGDICDPYAGTQRRILFDGFATLESTWRSIDLWVGQNDAAVPPLATSNADHRLWNPARGATGLAWHAEVGFTPPLAPQQAVYVGLEMMTASNNPLAFCQLHYNGSGWDFFVTNGLASVPAPSGKVALRIRSTAGTNFVRDLVCEIVGGATSTGTTQSAPTPVTYVGLKTQSTPFDYVDFIQD